MKNKNKWKKVYVLSMFNIYIWLIVGAGILDWGAFAYEGYYYLDHHLTSTVGDQTPILTESRALTESAKTTPEDVDSLATLDEGDKGKLASLITSTFTEDPQTALAVAKCESQLEPQRIGDTHLAKPSIGLFQINQIWHPYSTETLQDPQENVKIAKEIYDKGGWRSWSCYKQNLYQKYLASK